MELIKALGFGLFCAVIAGVIIASVGAAYVKYGTWGAVGIVLAALWTICSVLYYRDEI